MARQTTIYLLLLFISALIGTFFVVDRYTKTPHNSRNIELADRLATLTFACPLVATREVRDAQKLCRRSNTTEQDCFIAYRRLSDRFLKAAGRGDASDRCKITVENAVQADLETSARVFSGESPPSRHELDRRFRGMQKALGQPQVGCSNLNQACTGSARPGAGAANRNPGTDRE